MRKFKKIFFVLAVIFLLIFFRSAIFDWHTVRSAAMLPLLSYNDRVFVNKVAYGISLPGQESPFVSWGKMRRGDIVLVENAKDVFSVKRILGIAGDTIAFKNGELILNGEMVKEQSSPTESVPVKENCQSIRGINKYCLLESSSFFPPHFILRDYVDIARDHGSWVIPDNQIFVLGDNREQSWDSRHWGLLDKNRILGKVEFLFLTSKIMAKEKWNKVFKDKWFIFLKN